MRGAEEHESILHPGTYRANYGRDQKDMEAHRQQSRPGIFTRMDRQQTNDGRQAPHSVEAARSHAEPPEARRLYAAQPQPVKAVQAAYRAQESRSRSGANKSPNKAARDRENARRAAKGPKPYRNPWKARQRRRSCENGRRRPRRRQAGQHPARHRKSHQRRRLS